MAIDPLLARPLAYLTAYNRSSAQAREVTVPTPAIRASVKANSNRLLAALHNEVAAACLRAKL